MDKARVLAIKLLLRSEEQGYSNLILKAALEKESLNARDKQFVSALVYGTLEKQRLLDALLDLFLKKPCKKLDAPVRAILRCGRRAGISSAFSPRTASPAPRTAWNSCSRRLKTPRSQLLSAGRSPPPICLPTSS
jgi:hypothetical protein